jgi:hypothetical protein
MASRYMTAHRPKRAFLINRLPMTESVNRSEIIFCQNGNILLDKLVPVRLTYCSAEEIILGGAGLSQWVKGVANAPPDNQIGNNMKSPHSLSDDELREYAEQHLKYEVDMLIYSACILSTITEHRQRSLLSWTINNGLLDSFAIHARSLVDFLYSRSIMKDQSTDIIIEDYIDSEVVNKNRLPIPIRLEEVLNKANKQVAHLTLQRIDYERADKKKWNFVDIAGDILQSLASLAPHIPSTKISNNLKQNLINARLETPRIVIDIADNQNCQELLLRLWLRGK